jgi:hypothetical protein
MACTAFILVCITSLEGFSQTAFTSPVLVNTTGPSSSYNAVVASPESINTSTCGNEAGVTWAHNFAGTSNRRLNGFTITSTAYYVNNYGALSVVMRRNNNSGGINTAVATCPSPAIPWNDRQIAFFEGTVNTTTNVASLVNSFPSTTLPGTTAYNSMLDMQQVFSRGFVNSGADNIFNNLSGTGAGYNANANNIERMDVFVSGGIPITAGNINRAGIVLACRGTATGPNDDPFVLSAIKGLSGGGNVGGGTDYVYDDLLRFDATWANRQVNSSGATAVPAASKVTLLSNVNTVVLRRMDTDGTINDQLTSTDYLTASSIAPTQNIIGMFFTFADLGLTVGETFYGYSISANDVTATNTQQFNSFQNSTYFPLVTPPSSGGVDLTGFPGIFGAFDIDDDDDGLPDYLEANLPLAFGDHDADGRPNWCDPQYPGYIDNNGDGMNDNFDPSADSNNNGIPNYADPTFAGFIDVNANGVNDNFDWDGDGISNHLDKDSDNDGIPDVVESFGVDADGDGKIDNYSDTDVDGLSQNVDANNTGVISSGNGLGAVDTDADGIPNYFDLDSDSDGIPDAVEVYGTDANNDGVLDGYSSSDGDGYSDAVDGDVGNDGIVENAAGALLRSGTDVNNDGRSDVVLFKNMDADNRPNPYELDSDGDGLADIIEAGLPDSDANGRSDGTVNAKGWSTAVSLMVTFSLPNTDGTGKANAYDIDADDDGIPDNVESMATAAYASPAGADTDGDGIDNAYDNIAGYGGRGVNPVNTDGDLNPDYTDLDTDGDGTSDIIEGNDLNLNRAQDDNVTLTGTDTDEDGLDNRFDNNNSSSEGTSAYMGNAGVFTGDATPGSITTVQQSYTIYYDRDWRTVAFVLNIDFIDFKVVLQGKMSRLNWTVLNTTSVNHYLVERSPDLINFTAVDTTLGHQLLNAMDHYEAFDDVSAVHSPFVYYRLVAISPDGKRKSSSIIKVNLRNTGDVVLKIAPVPANRMANISVQSKYSGLANLSFKDIYGRPVRMLTKNIQQGNNTFTIDGLETFSNGVYFVHMELNGVVSSFRFIIAH